MKSKAESEIVKKLKEQLPRGYSSIIAEKVGCSKQYVSQVINSGNMDHAIWDIAIDLQQSEVAKIQKKKKKTCAMLKI